MTERVTVIATKPFEHEGELRSPAGEPFAADRSLAEQWQRLGILKIIGPAVEEIPEKPARRALKASDE